MLKWFNGCNATNIKKRYKELAFQYHPDRGGDTEIMKQINAEYDECVRLFAAFADNADTFGFDGNDTHTRNPIVEGEEFKEMINQIISLNADIEIIGCWIWIFNAYPYKDFLKSIGFKWASKKKAWAWHPSGMPSGRGKKTMNEIRALYGSERLKTYNSSKQLAAV